MHSAAMTIFGSRNNDFTLNWIADCPYAAVQISGANHIIMNNPDHPQFGPTPADAIEQLKPYIALGVRTFPLVFADLYTLQKFDAEVAPALAEL